MVWVESIVECQVRVVLSKYQSNLIINKEVMAILAKFNNLTLRVNVIQGQGKVQLARYSNLMVA